MDTDNQTYFGGVLPHDKKFRTLQTKNRKIRGIE